MTKKDYVLIAEAIKYMQFPIVENDYPVFRRAVMNQIGNALAGENILFDWEKWERYIFPDAV